ncbi:Calx-beta domain-containing protein [Geminocystis sp.]|uniref:Calx-beta domain-containing protein n=1 Tax=Geminocystis sp. TaxID=2664100 RepID=UPI003593EAF4
MEIISGTSGNDTLSGISTDDTIQGLNGNDSLLGQQGNDLLEGGSGNDTLIGGAGNDILQGGLGNDSLTGGAGNDLFALEYFISSSLTKDTDIVTDFVQNQDKIDLTTIGISDFATLQILLGEDEFGTAQITTRLGLSDGDYFYRLKINGFRANQLLSSDFNFSTTITNSLTEGTNNNDDLFGGLGNDTLQGRNGNDRLFGEQGNDLLQGGLGNDTLYGGAGNDLFALEYFISSSLTKDTDIVTDFVRGQDKINLTTIGISDFTTLQILLGEDEFGTAQITTRLGLSDGDYFYRLKVNGFRANQLLSSDFNFSTTITNSLTEGTNNNDDLFGGLGNDTLQGRNGNDRLFGERGNDLLQGGLGNDSIYGGLGDDTVTYTGTRAEYSLTSNRGVFTITDSINNRDGIDTLYGIQKIIFSDQTITIAPIESNPTLSINDVNITEGNNGTKNIIFTVTRSGTPYNTINVNYATANGTATAGNDYIAKNGTLTFGINETSKTITVVINGDTIFEPNETFFVNLTNAINATISDAQGKGTITNDDTNTGLLLLGTINGDNLVGDNLGDTLRGYNGNDTLTGNAGNDNINGGNGNDRITGGNDNDILLGSNGNDTIIGGSGNDTLYGGNGNDSLTGGTGSDRFVIKNTDEIIDRITDFSITEGDKIVISASGFATDLPSNTILASNRFIVGSNATTTNHRFIYNNTNGDLFFDEDGTGLIQSVKITTLNTGLTLTNQSIFVES